MVEVGGTNQKIENLILQMEMISDEISQGKWKGREDEVAQRVLSLFRSTMPFFDNDRSRLQEYRFTNSVIHLMNTLNGMSRRPEKVQETVQKLGYILQKDTPPEEWSAPGSLRDLKGLPLNTRNEIRSSMEEFRSLIEEKVPTATPALASWIQFDEIPLSKLNLSKKELYALAPHLKYLAIDTNELTEKEIHDLLSKCSNLESFVLRTDNIKTLSTLPRSLARLNCSLCPNLEEITHFNDNLAEFYSTSCEKLSVLPERTSANLRTFECGECPSLERYPLLNEGLQHLDISGNTLSNLPTLPSTLESLIMHDCPIKQLPEQLPKNLVRLNINRSEVERLPVSLPHNLQIEASWCVNLNIPESLSRQLAQEDVELIL
jgi:hypothetical protein